MTTRRFFLAGALTLLAAWLPMAQAADFPKGSPKFVTRYRAALSEAKKTGKPIVFVFSATWCGPCQKMKKDVYPSEAIKPYHDKFVWAYLDADDKDNEKLAKQYGVGGIPHIEIVDKDGQSLGKQVGSTSPETFAGKLKAAAEKGEKAAVAGN